MALVNRTIRARDGVALHVEEEGSGERAMLLCNGLYCSTHYYGPWFQEFARDHRVVAFDYRGHGKSEDPPDPAAVTLDTLVDDARTVLDTIEQPVILVGHSMGVRVALELAAKTNKRVDGIVLLCGSVFGIGVGLAAAATSRIAPPLLKAFGRTARLSRAVRDAVVHPEWMVHVGSVFGGLAHSTPRGPVEELARSVRRLDVRSMASIGRSYVEHTARPLLPQIKAPSIQVVGALDQLAPPSHAKVIERELLGCSTVVIDGCTHLAPIEAPDEVHRAVRSFLGKVLR